MFVELLKFLFFLFRYDAIGLKPQYSEAESENHKFRHRQRNIKSFRPAQAIHKKLKASQSSKRKLTELMFSTEYKIIL